MLQNSFSINEWNLHVLFFAVLFGAFLELGLWTSDPFAFAYSLVTGESTEVLNLPAQLSCML